MAGPRQYRGLTPDEALWIRTWNAAHHKRLDAQFDAQFPGPYGQFGRFSMSEITYPPEDRRFGAELFPRFFSPAFRARFQQSLADEAAPAQGIPAGATGVL